MQLRILLALLLPLSATAQSWDCNTVGAAPLEQLDGEGHAVQVTQYTCRVTGGALDGFVTTATNIWEFHKTSGKLLASSGIMRKPGAMLVFQADGMQELIMVDGRPGGWESVGTGVYKLATGTAAALAGRRFTFVARPSAAGTFSVEFRLRD